MSTEQKTEEARSGNCDFHLKERDPRDSSLGRDPVRNLVVFGFRHDTPSH